MLEHKVKHRSNEYVIAKFENVRIRVKDYMMLKNGIFNDKIMYFFLKYLQ